MKKGGVSGVIGVASDKHYRMLMPVPLLFVRREGAFNSPCTCDSIDLYARRPIGILRTAYGGQKRDDKESMYFWLCQPAERPRMPRGVVGGVLDAA